MSEPKYREWILETIDSLRSRKARPDLERICRMVRRRHGSDPDRTRTELEKLIQEQTVLKVSYKGSISYRNAAKVQRKSRKKSEFTPVGSGAEAARERTKHNNLNNNGDSAHSFTDQEEGEQESEPSPDPQPHTASTTGKKQKPPPSPTSGNDCLSCGATTGCAAGSGCREEKASASRDKGLGHQTGGGCPSPSHGHGTSAHDGVDASRAIPSKANAIRGGMEPGLSGAKEGSGIAADMEKKTCPGSASSNNNNSLPPKQKQTSPKVRVGGAGPKAAGDQANSDLGDRLVASVRSLSEMNLRGGSSAVAWGQTKPLGLKEILGYLSSQERLSEEKLTRGKVKEVLEREVARGRLRKTRCGNITLPARGMVEEPMAKNAPAARLPESSPQDRHVAEKEDEDEPMETDSGEDNQEENEEEEEEDPQSSEEEGGPSSPVVMETEPGPDNITAGSQDQESPQPQPHRGKGVPGASSLTRTVCPSAQGGGLSGCESTQLKESTFTEEDHMHMDAQEQMGLQCERRSHTSPGFKSSECKTEVGVSSCLLTPTASPKDPGQSEERGMNGGVSRGVYVKCEGVGVSPVDWTVSDVVSYFTAAGFPEQAVAFRTQEIDGKSLLLMQRNDVLTGLSIRLGPALKIYERHVKVLQKTHFEDDDC